MVAVTSKRSSTKAISGETSFDGHARLSSSCFAIAGSLARKKRLEVTSGTLPTHGLLFVVLLVGTIVLVGALTYVPALALGPVIEHLQLFGGAR